MPTETSATVSNAASVYYLSAHFSTERGLFAWSIDADRRVDGTRCRTTLATVAGPRRDRLRHSVYRALLDVHAEPTAVRDFRIDCRRRPRRVELDGPTGMRLALAMRLVDRHAAVTAAEAKKVVLLAPAAVADWLALTEPGARQAGALQALRAVLSDLPEVGHPDQARARTGRYSYEGNHDRLCTCGDAFGLHTAAPPHECMAGDAHAIDPARYPTPLADCTCTQFVPTKRRTKVVTST